MNAGVAAQERTVGGEIGRMGDMLSALSELAGRAEKIASDLGGPRPTESADDPRPEPDCVVTHLSASNDRFGGLLSRLTDALDRTARAIG